MLSNYLIIALRNLLKNKLFSLINICGMAISMACVITIGIYVHDELQFDKHIVDVENKYRIFNEIINDDGTRRKAAYITPMVGPTALAELPEVEASARFHSILVPMLFKKEEKRFIEKNGGFADPSFPEMFSMQFIEGQRESALVEPNSIILSRSVAEKYFDAGLAVGQEVLVANEIYKVTGVFENMSAHTHLQTDFILSMATLERSAPTPMKSWQWNHFLTYVNLQPSADVLAVTQKLQKLVENHAWPITKPAGSYAIPYLMPVTDIHLHATDQIWDIAIKSNAQTVYILAATGLFILVIASLNFINLSTARAVRRVKEVGVRKVVGAARTQLIAQFISESVVIAIVSFVIAGLIVELTLPALNTLTEKQFSQAFFLQGGRAPLLLLSAMLIGVAAGSYPAFYVSRYKPATILSGKNREGGQRGYLRMGLVTLQFILSFTLIIATLVAHDQLSFLRSKDLGFSRENVVILQLRGELRRNYEAARDKFMNHPNVLSASSQYGLPAETYASDIFIDGVTNKPVHSAMLLVDEEYVKTLDLKIVAGRDFSHKFPADKKAGYLVSESAAKLFGFPDPTKAVGHPISWHPWDGDTLKSGNIIGVIRDFHVNSLKEQLAPVVLHIYPQFFTTISLRVKSEDLQSTLAHFETVWKSLNTDWPFEYRFLDENFDKLYRQEEKLSVLFSIFSMFAILVACLGLFGLVMYSTTQRYREIGIRKIFGAGAGSLVVNLSKSYIMLMLIAFSIATPLSLYLTQKWLSKFPYRIDVSWLLFAQAALMITVIALLTVVVQSFRATKANPVDVLREQ